MTREPTPTIDAAIDAMFDRRADRGEIDGLRSEILDLTQSLPQARSWRLALPSLIPHGMARALILALLVVAIGGLGLLAVGAFKQEPEPTGTSTAFIRPFGFMVPGDPTIRLTADRRDVVVWISGPDIPGAPDARDPVGGSGVAGIVVGSAEAAWSHGLVTTTSPQYGGAGRFWLRAAPAEFLADLRDTADVPMGEIVETTFDGRPALTVLLPGNGGSDIHVNGSIHGLSADFVKVNWPARLSVADIDGATVFVLIWARTPGGLDAWLPVADELVSSIRFERGDQP